MFNLTKVFIMKNSVILERSVISNTLFTIASQLYLCGHCGHFNMSVSDVSCSVSLYFEPSDKKLSFCKEFVKAKFSYILVHEKYFLNCENPFVVLELTSK